jgi:hypothetical protein
MIEVNLEPYLEAAQARSEELGELKGSMRGTQANQVGALGELIGLDYLRSCGLQVEEVFSTSYDVAVNIDGKPKTLEFKTKERTVVPQPFYDCTVPAYNHSHQRPDYFLFISLLSSGKSDDITRFSRGFILGSITLERFEEVSTPWNPSQTDNSNGWKPTIECHNVSISQLAPPIRKGILATH